MIGFKPVPFRSVSCAVQPGTIAGWITAQAAARCGLSAATATTSAYLGDGQIAMLVGDASGKGVAAALMMASVQASLRTAAQFTGDNLAALFRAVNVQACASSLADRYATLFMV